MSDPGKIQSDGVQDHVEVVSDEIPGVDESSPFVADLSKLINHYSVEGSSDTPDFILSVFLGRCLDALTEAIRARDGYYGRQDPDSLLGNAAVAPPTSKRHD